MFFAFPKHEATEEKGKKRNNYTAKEFPFDGLIQFAFPMEIRPGKSRINTIIASCRVIYFLHSKLFSARLASQGRKHVFILKQGVGGSLP